MDLDKTGNANVKGERAYWMKMPDDFDDNSNMTLTVVMSIVAVSAFVGVILLAVTLAGIPVYEYTPLQVKQAVAGYGKAEKHQVMAMTQRILKLKEIPKPDDAADALAIAICHGRSATSLLNMERTFDPKRYDTR